MAEAQKPNIVILAAHVAKSGRLQLASSYGIRALHHLGTDRVACGSPDVGCRP